MTVLGVSAWGLVFLSTPPTLQGLLPVGNGGWASPLLPSPCLQTCPCPCLLTAGLLPPTCRPALAVLCAGPILSVSGRCSLVSGAACLDRRVWRQPPPLFLPLLLFWFPCAK